MNIFTLKVIALLAMFLDHIAYFFPSLSISLSMHWIGRIAAPIFLFGVGNALQNTHSKRMYIFRLYFASVIMAFIQTLTQIELNFFRILLVTACICSILELRKTSSSVSWEKVLGMYVVYQGAVCVICGYLCSISSANMESICFYLIPAIAGSVFSLEGGIVFAFLGVVIYLTHDNRLWLCTSYIVFAIMYTFLMSTECIPVALWKIGYLIPMIGTEIADGLGYLLSVIVGFDPMDIGGSLLTVQYQWMMIFALPLIMLYNHQRGRKCKYFFYIFYPLHITVLWGIAKFIAI